MSRKGRPEWKWEKFELIKLDKESRRLAEMIKWVLQDQEGIEDGD